MRSIFGRCGLPTIQRHLLAVKISATALSVSAPTRSPVADRRSSTRSPPDRAAAAATAELLLGVAATSRRRSQSSNPCPDSSHRAGGPHPVGNIPTLGRNDRGTVR